MITLTKRLKKEAENRNNSGTPVKHEHPAPKRISIRDKLLVKEVYILQHLFEFSTLFIIYCVINVFLGSGNGADHSFYMQSEV